MLAVLGPLGAPELVIILLVVVLIFGVGKLSDVGGALGNSIREFRKAAREGVDDEPSAQTSQASASTESASTESAGSDGSAAPAQAEQRTSAAFCSQCGTKLDGSSRFCSNCGAPVRAAVN